MANGTRLAKIEELLYQMKTTSETRCQQLLEQWNTLQEVIRRMAQVDARLSMLN